MMKETFRYGATDDEIKEFTAKNCERFGASDDAIIAFKFAKR
jgi:adenosine/AMP kinase